MREGKALWDKVGWEDSARILQAVDPERLFLRDGRNAGVFYPLWKGPGAYLHASSSTLSVQRVCNEASVH
jgi:hypothetical protein